MSPPLQLDGSAIVMLGVNARAVWLEIVEKATRALELDPEESQQLAEKANLFNQPDDPLELKSLEDLQDVLVGMNPVKGVNYFHSANPDWNEQKLQKAQPLEVLKAVLEMFQSDRWLAAHS